MKKFNQIKKSYTKAVVKATNDIKSLIKKNGSLVKENNQMLSAVKARVDHENNLLCNETNFANKMLEEIQG